MGKKKIKNKQKRKLKAINLFALKIIEHKLKTK